MCKSKFWKVALAVSLLCVGVVSAVTFDAVNFSTLLACTGAAACVSIALTLLGNTLNHLLGSFMSLRQAGVGTLSRRLRSYLVTTANGLMNHKVAHSVQTAAFRDYRVAGGNAQATFA